MKKVLIISYFYPPANFAGADRTAAWAKYLHESGFYPIIVTRKWNENQTSLTEKVSDNSYSYEKHKTHEIHRLPFRHSLRDQLAEKTRFRFIQRILTFIELFFSNFFINALPYSNLYSFSRKLLNQNDDVRIVLASGRPFNTFFIGYKLKKEFNIHWIPDYRDEWVYLDASSSNLIQKFTFLIEKMSQLKWVSNAYSFLTVSEDLAQRISQTIGLNGEIIKNGYDSEILMNKVNGQVNSNELVLLYIGTLYSYQPIEILVNSIKDVCENSEIKIKVFFIGVNTIKSELNRLNALVNDLPEVFKIIPRINKTDLKHYLHQCDLTLATSYEGLTGCVPIKLYDYYSFNKPVILCPSDNGVMEDFIKKTNSGFIVNSRQECTKLLLECIEKKKRGESIKCDRNYDEGKKYSRQYQTKLLGEYLNKLSI